MPKYYIWTIGCQMNKAESERLGSMFEKQGYRPAKSAEDAQVIVLNSCVVRQSAENRVIHKLDALRALKNRNPDITLAVTGCIVDSELALMANRFPHVDYFFKPGENPQWLVKSDSAQILSEHPAPSTFVPIMQGCNNFCTYCIVPYRRGRERSRPVADIICEVSELVRRGTKEVILLGQNVDSYGHNLPNKPDLADLLRELNGIDGLARIRFLTNHPKDMSSKLIQAIAGLEKVCEEISLPVQSGNNVILKAMGRGYTAEHYCKLIAEIRRTIPEVALSTDVIVGFPGESEEQFWDTYRLLDEIRFDIVHVAAYSPRPDTVAAKEFADTVPQPKKRERLHSIEELHESIVTEINAQLLGQTVEILVEGMEKGKWRGRTRGGKLVFFSNQDNWMGNLVNVTIDKTSPWSLQGTLERIPQ